MADYIDRKAVLNALTELYAFYGKEVSIPLGGSCLMNDIDDPRRAIEIAEKLVLSLSSADVVPVVRCKDCRYFRSNNENQTYCNARDGLSDPEENCFCNYGERKNNEEDI